MKEQSKPPFIAEWLLRKITKSEDKFSVLGDYCEEYNEYIDTKGKIFAEAWYWKQTITSIIPFVLNKLRWGAAMLKNYFKVTLRSLINNKGYSAINILGLSIGIASFLLILLFVNNELSYDRFHKNGEQIQRVNFRLHMGSNHFDIAYGPVPLAFTMKEDFPEVLEVVRLYHENYRGIITHVKIDDREFREEGFLYADSTFFKVFDCKLLEGDPETALNDPNSIILTEQTALKYFGDSDPMGKMLRTQDGNIYKVTGITAGMPVNSQIKFDLLANFTSHQKSHDPDWYDTAVFTYALLQKGAPPEQLSEKLPAFSRKYVEPVLKAGFGISYDEFIAAGNYYGFFLEPFLDVHLHSKVEGNLAPKGDFNTVIMFIGIAVFILIVGCVNFINLATAKSLQRANEVGIRKVVGSSKKQLIFQFLTESTLISFVSILIAITLTFLTLPYFNDLIGKQISTGIMSDWYFIPALLGLCLFVGFLSGGYPAFLLSSFRPVEVLKGKSSGDRGKSLRNSLVVFQFVTSIVLLVGTFVISDQMDYVRNKNLGFTKEHVIVIHSTQKLGGQQRTFKDQLKSNSDVINASYSDSLPQILVEIKNFKSPKGVTNEEHTLITIMSDYDLAETYQLKMKSGRFFSEDFRTDSSAVIINETAAKALGLDDPLNEKLTYMSRRGGEMNIIGVFEDFHMENLYEPIKPMAAMLLRRRPPVMMSVRMKPGNIQETLKFIENKWREFVPGQPFEYVFFDETYDEIYKTSLQAGKVFSAFSFLAIFIACLGLFGLASFTVTRKTKEIGIRKTMGASELGILFLLFKEFLKWIVVAYIVALPFSYFLMNEWLQDFAYRISIESGVFILAGGLAVLISLITVSYQSIKASRANPVDALKYE